MPLRHRRPVLLLVVAVLAATPLLGQAVSQAGAARSTLSPPPGNVPILTAHAIGTQNYLCVRPAQSGQPAWVFLGPQATLSVPAGGTASQQVVTHFLSPVPDAPAVATPGCRIAANGTQLDCPTWQSSLDSSRVWGALVAQVPAGTVPSCPNRGAVACLLLRAVATWPGSSPNGGPASGALANTTYVQRLHTGGGTAPTGACRSGDVDLVPYSADYTFYRAGQSGHGNPQPKSGH